MESNNHNFKLIDGEFSAEEAQKVLMSLINYKIDFHHLVAFSNHIRFNNDIEGSKKRIEELTKTKDEIAEITKMAKLEGYHFAIKSDITLELVKNKELVE